MSPLTRTCQTFLDSWDGLYHKRPQVWEVSTWADEGVNVLQNGC